MLTGRPGVLELDGHLLARRLPVLDVAVHHQLAHRAHPLGVAAAEPMEDVEVVRALLKEQAGGEGAVGVPVAEVGLAAVAHEVPAPCGLHLADPPLVDPLLHLLHHPEIAHVVPDEQLRAARPRRVQHPVAPLDGDRHRLLQVDRDARVQEGQGLLLVEPVGGEHEHGVEPHVQQLAVVRDGLRARDLLPELRLGLRVGVGEGDELPPFVRSVREEGQGAAQSPSDHTESHVRPMIASIAFEALAIRTSG
jgi:hypothetical protein